MKNQYNVGANNFHLISTSFGIERRRESEHAGGAGAWLERILEVALRFLIPKRVVSLFPKLIISCNFIYQGKLGELINSKENLNWFILILTKASRLVLDVYNREYCWPWPRATRQGAAASTLSTFAEPVNTYSLSRPLLLIALRRLSFETVRNTADSAGNVTSIHRLKYCSI